MARIASFDVSGLEVTPGHDSLTVTWAGFFNDSGGENVRQPGQAATGFENAMPWLQHSTPSVESTFEGEISGWVDTSFGHEGEDNDFNFANGEKIVVSVMNKETGIFSLTNKVIHDHTDLSNTNEYTVEGLTAGENYVVMLKAYKTDTSGSLRIYENGGEEPTAMPFTVPEVLTPVVRTLGSETLEVRLSGTKEDYFITGLSETGFSALNYISVVLVEEGSGNIEISTSVAPLNDTVNPSDPEWSEQLVWTFEGRNSQKKHIVRLDYENDSGTIVSTEPITIEMAPCGDISSVNVDLIDYMDVSLNWGNDTFATQNSTASPFTTKLEFKASTSFGTTPEEFESLPILCTKVYSSLDEDTVHNFKLLNLGAGISVEHKLLQIGFYHAVNENGNGVINGPKSYRYIVLLPKDGQSPWATLPDSDKYFKLLRGYREFTISSEGEPELDWFEELSAAYHDGDLSNMIGHGNDTVLYDSEYNTYGGDRLFVLDDLSYTYDWSGELLLPKTFDTTHFDLDSAHSDHVPAVFGLVDGVVDGESNAGVIKSVPDDNTKQMMQYNGGAAHNAANSEISDNVVINVWKRTCLNTNYTYEYKAYQVKDREFANETSLNITAQGSVNQETLTLSWSAAENPVTTSTGTGPYYFAGLDICGEPKHINHIRDQDQALLPDASFQALSNFHLSNKNTLTSTTTTIVSDNSFSLIRVRPYFTITNSDNTTDEVSGAFEDLSFVGYKLPVISEINIGNLSGGFTTPLYEEAQGSYYPFNTQDLSTTLLNDPNGGNMTNSGEYIIQILTSGGAGYRTAASNAGNNYHSSAERADVSVNFLVSVQDMSDLDLSFEFHTNFGDSSYVAVPQQPNAKTSSTTAGGGGLWGTSGEYYLSIPVSHAADGDAEDHVNLDTSGVPEGRKFKVTIEPYINTIENPSENICGDTIVEYLYTRPSLDPVLHTKPLIGNDVNGNASTLTSSIVIDISGADPSGEFISKIEFFRDEDTVPFKTLNPVVTRGNDGVLVYNEDAKIVYGAGSDREVIDNTAYPGSAHYYRAKVHYEHGWVENDMMSENKELIYKELKLKDHGFENMIVTQLTDVDETGATFDLSKVDISLIFKPFTTENSTMYKHFVQMRDVAENGIVDSGIRSSMNYYYINSLGLATTLDNVESNVATVANFHTEPVGIMMSNVDLSDVKLLDLSYSVIVDKTVAGARILKDVRDDNISGKKYVIHNYVNRKATNVVVEAVHTGHDAIPDQTLLAFDLPKAYDDEEMTSFGELDTFELVIDGVSTDISIEEGAQLIPNSENTIQLKTKFTFDDNHPEIITSQDQHGESGLDLVISRPHDDIVTFSSPNDTNAYPVPSSMEIVDDGDCSGVLKFTVPQEAVGAILFRTHGEYGNEDEICGWNGAELLNTSTGKYLGWSNVTGTGIYTDGNHDNVHGSWSVPSNAGANDAPAGYIDFSFDNVDGLEYKFGIHMDDCSYGDRFGARLVYSDDGATAVSNLKMLTFNSAKTPTTDPHLEITDIKTSTSPNQVTFEMKENNTEHVSAKYEIIVYEDTSVYPWEDNGFNMWDGNGANTVNTAKALHAADADWKATRWDTLNSDPSATAIIASSMSNSVTLSNPKLQSSTKLYLARGFVINTNGDVRSTTSTDTIAFDMVELGNSPSVSLVPNEIDNRPYTTVTIDQENDPAARFIEVKVEGDTNTDTGAVEFIAGLRLDNAASTVAFGFADRLESTNAATRNSSTIMHLTDVAVDISDAHHLGVKTFATTQTAKVLPKNIIGTWDEKLKFNLSSDKQDLHLKSDDFPDISLTIYPSIYSDRPPYSTGDVALQLYEVPVLHNGNSANHTNGLGIYLREYASGQATATGASDSILTNNIARDEVHVMAKDESDPNGNGEGGQIDSLIMVVGFENNESEGVTVKTFNRSEGDAEWDTEVVNKTFTIDGLPTDAMIVSVTVIATNLVGTSNSVTETAGYVDE